MIGIYKITSPSGKIYIGQTTNYESRLYRYKVLDCKQQIRLYNSLIKYTVDNHIFEFIEECNIEQLNERERYYQDFYNVISKNGLNCKLTETNDKSGKLSEETKLKISLGNKGKSRNSEKRKGVKLSEEHKRKIGLAAKGRECSVETRQLRSIALKGKKRTEEQIKRLSLSKIGINRKKIINTETGEIYFGMKDCCDKNNLNIKSMYHKLSGHKKNNTPYVYYTV